MSKIRAQKDFKTVVVEESLRDILLKNSGKCHRKEIEDTLEHYEHAGWSVVSLENDSYRTFLFWSRNRTTLILARPVALRGKGAEFSPSSLGS